jgi:signal transduction histidine kinase
MSSLDNIYQDTAREPRTGSFVHHAPPNPEQARQIGGEVAHDLNNILTVIQGYADKLLMCHGDNPALRPDLQVISENARRAVAVVRKASPRKAANALIG